MNTTAHRIAITATLAAGIALVLPAIAAAQPQEDDPGWSCVNDSSPSVCGPLSDDWGHAPGCYNDQRELVAAWPCSVVVNPDGSSDVYTPDAR